MRKFLSLLLALGLLVGSVQAAELDVEGDLWVQGSVLNGLRLSNAPVYGQGLRLDFLTNGSITYPTNPDVNANFMLYKYTNTPYNWSGIGGYTSGCMWLHAPAYSFWTHNWNGLQNFMPALFMNGTGVGLGNYDPQAKLHVVKSGVPSGITGVPYDHATAIFQNSAAAANWAGINIISGSTGSSHLYLGSTSNATKGRVSYDSNASRLTLGANGSTGNHLMIEQNGNVGIGTAPSSMLDVNGVLTLRAQSLTNSTVPATGSNGILYANSNGSYDPPGAGSAAGVYVAYNSQHTRLASHKDPREIDPQAVTSFSDPSVDIPFSFNHFDTLIGKEEIVDMAKMVAWAERKMKSELGEQNGKLVYTRQLPAQMRQTVEQHQTALKERQAEEILGALENMPWVKVPVEAGGNIPQEALIEVPAYETVMKKVTVKKRQLDLKARKVVLVDSEEDRPAQVPTGRTETQLRPNWRFVDGELYRKPTLNDIDIDALIKKNTPQMPKWVQERIHAAKQTSMDVEELAGQIREILATREAAPVTQQARMEDR